MSLLVCAGVCVVVFGLYASLKGIWVGIREKRKHMKKSKCQHKRMFDPMALIGGLNDGVKSINNGTLLISVSCMDCGIGGYITIKSEDVHWAEVRT